MTSAPIHPSLQQVDLAAMDQASLSVLEQLIDTMLLVFHSKAGAFWMGLENRIHSLVIRKMSIQTLYQLHHAAVEVDFGTTTMVQIQGQNYILSSAGYPLFRVCVAVSVQELRPYHRQLLPRFARLVRAILQASDSPARMSSEEQGYQSYRKIVEDSLRRLGEMMQAAGCVLLWFSSWSSKWHRFAVGGVPGSLYQHFWDAPTPGDGLAQWIQATRRAIERKGQSCIAEELLVRNVPKGCIFLWRSQQEGEFTSEEIEWLRITVQMMATSLDILETQTSLLQRVYHDPLTGVFNRLYFEMAYRQVLASAQRHPRPVSLLMIDVDGFKTINDTYGHEAGDLVLQVVGSVLQHVRAGDVPARYGGDEFVVLLPDTDKHGARALAQRLHCLFQQAMEQHSLPVAPTLSIGVATVMNGEPSLLLLADQDMYEQKRLEKASSVCSKLTPPAP